MPLQMCYWTGVRFPPPPLQEERKLGCDIHMYVERKVGNKWEMIKNQFPDPYHWDNRYTRFNNITLCQWDDSLNSIRVHGPYVYSNYNFFSILADVRNEKRGGEFYREPISVPKGVPDGVSVGIQAEIDYWVGDGHSHSYFTLAELNSVDWDKYDYSDVGTFISEVMPVLNTFGDPDEVRIVFWFDN